jgi:hypothetical protein
VFILGAGASNEVRLPTGFELKSEISSLLDIRFEGYRQIGGDGCISQALNCAAKDINPFLHAAWRIRDAMTQAISIDNFIDAHSGDSQVELCGKLAIAKSILAAEDNSLLQVDRNTLSPVIQFSHIDDTWFISFFRLLTENCRSSDLAARLSSVGLIVFNYDRCIEHYLYFALQNYYGISDKEAASLVAKMDIFHPYGKVGGLPWIEPNSSIAFGGSPSARQLFDLAKQIRTFTEGTDIASSDIHKIRTLVATASRIVFLGFAFHRLNLDLLQPATSDSNRVCQIFASGYGISDHDAIHIAEDISARWSIRKADIVVRAHCKCAKLFNEHWRALSLN